MSADDREERQRALHVASSDEGTVASDNFLRRWSRRKTAARQVPSDPEAQTPQPAAADAPPAGTDPGAEAEPGLPPLDLLGENSDVSGFLSPRVSEELRRLALRKLFHSPKFNLRDGLDDYDEDYRALTVMARKAADTVGQLGAAAREHLTGAGGNPAGRERRGEEDPPEDAGPHSEAGEDGQPPGPGTDPGSENP